VAASKLIEGPVGAAVEPRQRSDWTAVDHRYQAFSINLPGFGESDYAIQRHAAGGRKDILSFGTASGPGSWLAIEVYRPGEEVSRFGDPASEVAAATIAFGGPYRLTPTKPIAGKFGPMPIFEFTARTGGRSRSCLGFAHAFGDPSLQIAGWHCTGDVEVVDRSILACAIEGLSLLAAASEPKVQELFARAESKRTFCKSKVPPRGASLRRNDWIEAPRDPKLRRGVAR
jgi:hypothetical protein